MNPSNKHNTPLKRDEELTLTQLKNSLPQELWFDGRPMHFFQGFWALHLENIIAFQSHFQAQDTDILATSFRKVGTTWLKSLIFAICDRVNHPPLASPLLTHNPHELVPQFETNIYAKSKSPDFSNLKNPRIFGTHVPFSSLPSSIKDESNCKIIYISRNPFDTFVSSWLFYKTIDDHVEAINNKVGMYDKFFDMFCEGKIPFGPFDEHVLGYWKASLEKPEKVLFIKYEDLKVNPTPQLKAMAEFVGCPFSKEEELNGVIDDIVKLCSIENLKEVANSSSRNKSDRVYPKIKNYSFFRKGEVGDWVNHLTPSMAKKLEKIMEEKFQGSGLSFER